MQKSTKIFGATIIALLLITGCIWYAVVREDRGGKLTVSFLNIGQGDSIFIESPSGRQVLIDGGPNRSVLRELSKVMPWYDRTIDVIIPTHPDADHVTGLIDVLARYQVAMAIQSSVQGDTDTWRTLEKAIDDEHAQKVTAMRGQIVDLGKGAYLEILFPDRLLPNAETNTASVVARLVYGTTSFMLTGDSPQPIEDYLVKLDADELHSDVLKAGHHGSRTSSDPLYVGFVSPEYAVFSRGCDNKYGHPHQEVVDLMARFGIPTLDTCKDGTITFISDGKTIVHK